jgi:O-antigen/teichoic acid export membrane protein
MIKFFYSEEFLGAVWPFQILLIGTLAFSGWRILSYDIYARGKPMINTWITGFSAVLNTVLNIIYIPKFGIAGAAWATTISYSAMLAVTIYFYGKMSGNRALDIFLIKKSDFVFYKKFFGHAGNLIKKYSLTFGNRK